MLVFLPITTQSTQAATTIPATSALRAELKRVDDKAEPPAPNNDLESRLSSLLAGNNTGLNHLCRVHDGIRQQKYFILYVSLSIQVPGDA